MRLIEDLYNDFGVTEYHANGIFGQGVSIMVIDTGMSNNSHGLAVSSIIHPPENNVGLRGIAPQARVEIADLYDSSSIPITKVMAAIQRAIHANVDIISISLGTSDSWGPLQDLINKAYEKGILTFAAAGNSGERGYEYPAACANVISVASVNSAREPSSFNTRNDSVVVYAPAEGVLLPLGDNGSMKEFNGTSFATPFAAGLAALIICEKGRLPRQDMITTLRNPKHLHLNCETHTYIQEKTCVDYPIVPVKSNINTVKLQTTIVVLAFLAVAIVLILR